MGFGLMRFHDDMRRWWPGAAALALVVVAVGCSLNPQPLPPETPGDGGTNDGTGGGDDASFGGDGGITGAYVTPL